MGQRLQSGLLSRYTGSQSTGSKTTSPTGNSSGSKYSNEATEIKIITARSRKFIGIEAVNITLETLKIFLATLFIFRRATLGIGIYDKRSYKYFFILAVLS